MKCKIATDGFGYKLYLKREDVEQLGFKKGDQVEVTIERPKEKVE